MDCGLRGKDRAEWLADKIPAYGDYAKEAALVLIQQADEIVALRTGVNECCSMLLAEPNTKLALDKAETLLRELMTPNV